MTVLAVDAGTTEIKTVGFDADGQVRATARRAARVAAPHPGFAEQDMVEVWDAVADTIREAATGGGVTTLALTGQGDGCWLVDPAGAPTGPAVLWNDGRAASLVDRWRLDGRLERAFRVNGSLGFAGSPHAILAWLADHQPDRVRSAAAALTCTGWLFRCLTGAVAIDESDAAAPWLDLAGRRYASEILELFELPWARRLLPPVRRDGDRVAPLSAPVAEQLGLPAGIPVVLAPYDLVATSVGAGAVADRQAVCILGTTLSTQTTISTLDLTGSPTGLTLPFGARYLRALPTLAGTQVLSWAAGLLGLPDAAGLTELAGAGRPGAGGVVFLPYLSPAGERAPFLDPRARGGFAGLRLDHDRTAIARAVLEGLTFTIRECAQVGGLAPAQLRLSGGGANSPQWCQLIADVLGVPVVRAADREAGARGAYCVGLVATGAVPDLASAVAGAVPAAPALPPDPDRHRHYDALFADFLAIRDAAARGWR